MLFFHDSHVKGYVKVHDDYVNMAGGNQGSGLEIIFTFISTLSLKKSLKISMFG